MPRRSGDMGETERREWVDRLSHADEVWSSAGITANGANAKVMKALDAYRGKQWEYDNYLSGVDVENHLVVNLIFSIVNTAKAQNMARNPKVSVFGLNEDTAENASNVEALYNYYVETLKFKRQWNRAIGDAYLMPLGIVRHGYTPREWLYDKDGSLLERYAQVRPDAPWIRRIPIWDIRIDPLAETFDSDGDARWCAFRSLYTMRELKRNPMFTVPEDLTATISKDKRVSMPEELKHDFAPEAGKIVEVWTVYDREERKWFCMSPGSQKLLRQPNDWPIPWTGLPYDALYFNDQGDNPFPVPFLDPLMQLQMELNKVRTIANEYVKRMRVIVALSPNALADKTDKVVESAMMEAIYTSGNPREAIEVLKIAGFDQGLILYAREIVNEMREMVGQGQMDRAQRINVETATEANNVQLGSDTQRARIQDAVEQWLGDSIRHFAQGVRTVTTEDVLVPIVGQTSAQKIAQGAVPFLRVSPEELAGEYGYSIVVGSTAPRSQREEMAKNGVVLEMAKDFPQVMNINQAIVNQLRALDQDPSSLMLSADQMQAAMAQPPPGGLGAGPEPAGQPFPAAAFLQNGGGATQ